ncbi:MAG: hypothetical protein ACJ79S_04285 [Gemmatimonadaceae bacterium]
MSAIPRDGAFDGTLRLLADPYRFVSTRCARHGSDVFETRIILRRAAATTTRATAAPASGSPSSS